MRKIFCVIELALIFFVADAQTVSPELVSSAGDSFFNTSYQLDWSIGELQTEIYVNEENILTQGFHQSAYIITLVKDLWRDVEISLYPNPTNDLVNLKFKSPKVIKVQFSIIDLQGNILQKAEMKSDLERIDFTKFAAGTYFVLISQDHQVIKSFKIIKNQ